MQKALLANPAAKSAAKLAAVDPLAHLTFRDIKIQSGPPEILSARFTYLKGAKIHTMDAWNDAASGAGATAGGGINLSKLSRLTTVADSISAEATRIGSAAGQIVKNMTNSDLAQNLLKLAGFLRQRVTGG